MDEAENEIILAQQGRAGIVRLSRPKALNALTYRMIQALEPFYHLCARNPDVYGILVEAEGKAFCAGGDIRAIRDWAEKSPEMADRYYADEYQHNWTLECFRKPHVALIDGVVMGGGVGISIYGTHRVGGEGMRFAMPETGIGFFPDIGAGWFFPRLPGHTGMYLGLSGRICDQADAHYLGVATHCVRASKFEAIKAAMIEGEPIDTVLDGLHEPPGESELARRREVIDRIFFAPSLDDVFRNLENEDGPERDWARETLAALSVRSPLALKVTFEQLKRGKTYNSLKEALIVEYRLATRMVRRPDFIEGVRAVLIDKDQSPKWQPATLSEVTAAMVQSQFEPLPKGDLKLVDYWKGPGIP
jgi:enoyl-CoA hydratase